MQDIFVWGDTPRGPEIAELSVCLSWNEIWNEKLAFITSLSGHCMTKLEIFKWDTDGDVLTLNSRSYYSWLHHYVSGNRSWTESKCWIDLEEISWCQNIVVVSRLQDKLWDFLSTFRMFTLTGMFSGPGLVNLLTSIIIPNQIFSKGAQHICFIPTFFEDSGN